MTFNVQGVAAAVVGAGRSGRAAAALLLDQGARVLLVDQQPIEGPLPQGLDLAVDPRGFNLADRALVVVSPGVPWSHPDLVRSRQAGAQVIAEVELASRFLAAPLAAITGTNGKSTCTALLGELLRAGGQSLFVGGNLGTPLSEAVGQRVDGLVVELSSFQLEGIQQLHPRAAAILNLTPDHLDRYRSLEDYAQAKARILENQSERDVAVLNAADPWFGFFRERVRGRLQTFASDRRPASAVAMPQGFAIDGVRYRLGNPALRGAHNCENAMAATLLALDLGIEPTAAQRGLDRFEGLPHRLELVRSLHGAEWINDSKATNVSSSAVALAAIAGPLTWIAGGRGKGSPYAPLVPLLGERLQRALLIGEDAARIAGEVGSAWPGRVEDVGTLERAVALAAEMARPGTVLLSPACASYDQFRDYQERGNRFRELVAAL